jgi:hypothetical protein
MSLDILFEEARSVCCPCCGQYVITESVAGEISGGRVWYDILEDIGYYVPHDQRTEENDWYGKDMALTNEQAEKVYWYIMNHREIDNGYAISGLIARALLNKNTVVINADW